MVGIFTVKVDADEPVQEVDERDEHERMLDELLDDVLGSDDEDVGDEVTERPQLRRQDAQLRLGDELGKNVARALRDAIIYSRANEDAALDYALDFGRGVDRETGRRFVRMYVNEDTVDFGDDGRRALETLYRRAAERGIIPEVPPLDIVEL